MKHKKTGLIAEVENTSHIYRRQNCIASLLPSRRCFYFVWVIKNTEENGLGLTASFQSSTHLTITCRWYDKELHCRRWPPVSLVHPLNVRRVNMQASVDWVMMCAGLLLRRRIIVMFRYNRTITKNLVNKGYFFYFSSNDNKFINRQNFR